MTTAPVAPVEARAEAPAPSARPRPRQGEWTYEDYLALPDDGNRYEIIDGVLYVANAPSYDHQFTVGELFAQLHQHVKERGLGVVITAPFEVHLPGIAKPVQPDVLFIAAARQPQAGARFFEGAPDLIVEVLSPGSMRLDYYVKFGAYERAGVREYWIADPRTRTVVVYALGPGEESALEYALFGAFGPGEQIRSSVLPDLAIALDPLFVPT
ncbi:MAG: Uma2 family endonuclease [Candidatus Brachytrichaceae bacterium NZ_4S206]|jgi:Uma2 family endonuclease